MTRVPVDPSSGSIVGSIAGRYVVDSEGNVYSRLKTQGKSDNPRYHLWDGEKCLRFYVADIRSSLLA